MTGRGRRGVDGDRENGRGREYERDKKVGRRMHRRGEGKQIQSLKCVKERHRGKSKKYDNKNK